MVVSILPAVAGVQTQNTLNGPFKHENSKISNLGVPKSKILTVFGDAKINLNGNTKQLEVKAASKYSKKMKKVKRSSKYRYKKVKAYKYKKYRYKKVKAAYKKTIYKKIVPTSVGAKNVVVTSEYVMATGRHSCAIKSDYNYHTRVFRNYNPVTKTNGTLRFEQGPYYGPNRGTSPEGLWYDVKTDMDFCLVHGMSHDKRRVFLIPYNGTINGKKVVNGYFV
ncbi:MAG: hypothetical protein PQ963_00825 [Methanobacterium sp.]|jgi:hypothetical protein